MGIKESGEQDIANQGPDEPVKDKALPEKSDSTNGVLIQQSSNGIFD